MKVFDKANIDNTFSILYVEDDPDIRTIMLEVLPLLVDTVFTAENGKDGLLKYQENKPDIIVTDIQMPEMTGLEMIKEIRKDNEDIPFIITSAFNDNSYMLEAIALGVEHYLIKPMALMQLEAKLERVKKYIMQERELKAYQSYLEKRVDEEVALGEAKEQLLLSQNKDAELGQMVSIIAHQWKQPLHYLHLLIEDIQYEHEANGLDKAFVVDFVAKGIERIKFLSDTMDNFLRFYKSNNAISTFSAEKVVREVGFFLSVLFKAVGVTLEIKVEKDFKLKGVENTFQQVILNLLNNAKEAFEGLKRRDAEIVITLDVRDGKKIIEVSDNATGISEDALERIYDMEYTNKASGTGIGLYLVKKIITEDFSGNIEAKNRGKGACFELAFASELKVAS